jgi:LmbE family N-acetylglucosaminyl deacetylase
MTEPRVLAIFAHPDDESLVASGTLAACAAAGAEVALVCMTRGEQGPSGGRDGVPPDVLGTMRETELRMAGAILGLGSVECLGFPDGELKWVRRGELISILVERLRCWRPGLVITFGSDGLYGHPDHVAVFRAVTGALALLTPNDLSPSVYSATWPRGSMARLVDAAAARGFPHGIWGIDPADFGVRPKAITVAINVRSFLPIKLRALRSYHTQLLEDNLFHHLPDDLAADFLGEEFFVRVSCRCSSFDPLAALLPRLANSAAAPLQRSAKGRRMRPSRTVQQAPA